MENSGLPGPRGNLERAQAVAAEGNEALFLNYLAVYNSQVAPVNTPGEFLAFLYHPSDPTWILAR